MKHLIIVATMVLVGCQSTPHRASNPNPPSRAVPVQLTEADTANVQAGVKQMLKDPGSAMFGSIAGARTPEGILFACGTVNARNSFGGYAGYKPFFVGITKEGTFGGGRVASDKNSIFAVLTICRRNNIRT